MSEDRFASSAREYVESLHQNSRTHLLYGKNNVLVQPVRFRTPPDAIVSSHLTPINMIKENMKTGVFIFSVPLPGFIK